MVEPAITFELVQDSDEHARLVMDWRNDPDTLAMSFHHEPKRWPEFRVEFARDYFIHPDLPPLLALSQGQRVGFLRSSPLAAADGDPGRRACALSINVANSARGHGLGRAILRAVQPWLRRAGYDDVWAEVRVENARSRAVFERAGFSLERERDKLVADTGERCRILLYRARLTRPFPGLERVFVIAEAGSNWRAGTPARDRAMARALIDVAAEAGADAVKFQTYRPETVYVANAGTSDYLAQAGIEHDIREIFADLAMPYELIPELQAYCRKRSVAFMSTPFSIADFDQLDAYVDYHKCASYENGHLRLLERFAASGKPLFMSTGASTEAEIAWAVDTFFARGGNALCLLQCTARYPAPLAAANLAVLPRLQRAFGLPVGLSDHTRESSYAPIAAVALGARAIEKHFTLDRRLPGPDHAFALTSAELTDMVKAIRATELALGDAIKAPSAAEAELRAFARRGLQATRPIARGELLREGVNVDILRPGKQRRGAHPALITRLEGKHSARDIPLGDGIQEGDWID